MSEKRGFVIPKVKLEDVREIGIDEFLRLLDSNSRLRDLHSVATKEYVSFYYLDNDKIHHLGFIRKDFKCFIGGI